MYAYAICELPSVLKKKKKDNERTLSTWMPSHLNSVALVRQTHYFLKNMAAPGIELGISRPVARHSDH
jgi:hypothetical protein